MWTAKHRIQGAFKIWHRDLYDKASLSRYSIDHSSSFSRILWIYWTLCISLTRISIKAHRCLTRLPIVFLLWVKSHQVNGTVPVEKLELYNVRMLAWNVSDPCWTYGALIYILISLYVLPPWYSNIWPVFLRPKSAPALVDMNHSADRDYTVTYCLSFGPRVPDSVHATRNHYVIDLPFGKRQFSYQICSVIPRCVWCLQRL